MTTFQLALLEEAKIFLKKISPQARKKYCTIFGELQVEKEIVSSLKSYKILKFGNFVHSIMELHIDFLLFGIRKDKL